MSQVYYVQPVAIGVDLGVRRAEPVCAQSRHEAAAAYARRHALPSGVLLGVWTAADWRDNALGTLHLLDLDGCRGL
jgi:hypothetical protein